MARELRRLLIAPERLGAEEVALERAEAHYLGRVLRLRPGDRFAVVDGAGRLWSARLLQADRAALEQPLAAPLQRQPAPAVALQLAVALPRRDADVLLRMACELGVDQCLPLRAERSVDPEPLRPDRAATILREALEQCERLWQPQLAAPQAASALLGAPPPGGPGRGLLCTTRCDGIPLLAAALAGLGAGSEAARGGGSGSVTGSVEGCVEGSVLGSVTVAIGPEGGWSAPEEALALQHGWQPVGLGSTILRCSTAAVTAAALLSHWRAALP